MDSVFVVNENLCDFQKKFLSSAKKSMSLWPVKIKPPSKKNLIKAKARAFKAKFGYWPDDSGKRPSRTAKIAQLEQSLDL